MKRFVFTTCFFAALFLTISFSSNAQSDTKNMKSGISIPVDTYGTDESALHVTVVGHGSLMFEYKDKIIHVDPYSNVANYTRLPKADLVLLTHEHADHLDTIAINMIRKADTHFIVSAVCNTMLGYGDIINNGNKTVWENITIEAVPAYNNVNRRPNGDAYHPKKRGNGYILTFGNQKVYIAGDTENINEMKKLKGTIDIAFLPKNVPYTMNDEMFIDAATKIQPKNLYPYHFSEFNEEKIAKALTGMDIKLLIKPMSNK